MIVMGYLIENVTSSPRKWHAAFALPDGRRVVHYGDEGNPGAVRPRQFSSHAHASAEVLSLFNTKTAEGFSNKVVDLCTAEVPDGTSDADLKTALIDAHTNNSTTTAASGIPAAVKANFDAMMMAFAGDPAAAAQVAAQAAAQRVADRAALRLEPGEIVTRPNGEIYRPRALGGHTDVAALRAMRAQSLYCLLGGLPGTGKTALADAALPDLIDVQCHDDMTVAHLVGSHQPTPDGGWRWEDGPLTIAMRKGRPLLLDEIHRLPQGVSPVLHSALDGRRFIRLDDRPDDPMVYAADGFYVIGTYNPNTLGAAGLSEAIVSRFPVQITVTTDYDAARAMGVPAKFVTIAENLNTKHTADLARGGMGLWAPQMRELLSAKRLIDAGLGEAFAAQAMIAQCPVPEDLPVVIDVVKTTLGYQAGPLTLGAQVN